ncbi:MAG TPA: helix-turn-helix domain-containing protein [Gammaproteobacteria bacterium]
MEALAGKMGRVLTARSVTRSYPGRPCWAEIVTSALGTSAAEVLDSEDRFFGRLVLWNLGALKLAHVNLRGAVVRGVRRSGASGGVASYLWLATSLTGCFELGFDRRTALIEPGTIAILDVRRTYVTTFSSDNDLLWVRVPRAYLEPSLAGRQQVIIDGSYGGGKVAFETLKTVLGQAPNLRPYDGGVIAEGVVSMVRAAAYAAGEGALDGRLGLHDKTLNRVKAYIRENLADESLSASSIARATGLSVRYINKLFEREGTSLMRWTWRQRLEGARSALANAESDERAIGEIAYAFGFKNASHFSRAFRRYFGDAPRNTRRANRAGSSAAGAEPV